MVSLQCRPDLAVGIDFIDTDHQQLVELFIELSGLLRSDEVQTAALEKLDEIVEFARQHFHLEERLMLESGYAQFEQHKHTHETLLQVIVTQRRQLPEDDHDARRNTMDCLEHWLMDHILDSDKHLGTYLSNRLATGDR